MKNEFTFSIRVRCGKRTEPDVNVSYIGTSLETMQIGSQEYTKKYLAEWIEGTILRAVKNGNER